MLVDSFANRLDLALKRNNMRPIDLSNKTHIDKSSISRYLSGDWKASQKRLTLIAMALNTNESWLMGYDVSDEPNRSHMNHKSYETIKNNSDKLSLKEKKEIMLNYMNKNKIENLFAIPLYKKIENNIESSEDYIEGYIPLNPNMYNMKNPNDYFYIKMPDDSMDQKYKKGDYILMKKSSTIKSNTIALIEVDNIILIRKVTPQENLVLLEPLSYDTATYKTQAYPKNNVKILGTVIGHIGYE